MAGLMGTRLAVCGFIEKITERKRLQGLSMGTEPVRKACDECHASKVRCVADSDRCQRCIRLNLSCRFSPMEVKKRKVEIENHIDTFQAETHSHMEFGLPAVDLPPIEMLPVAETDWQDFLKDTDLWEDPCIANGSDSEIISTQNSTPGSSRTTNLAIVVARLSTELDSFKIQKPSELLTTICDAVDFLCKPPEDMSKEVLVFFSLATQILDAISYMFANHISAIQSRVPALAKFNLKDSDYIEIQSVILRRQVQLMKTRLEDVLGISSLLHKPPNPCVVQILSHRILDGLRSHLGEK